MGDLGRDILASLGFPATYWHISSSHPYTFSHTHIPPSSLGSAWHWIGVHHLPFHFTHALSRNSLALIASWTNSREILYSKHEVRN